jgi:hypothetical protein
MFPKTTSQHQLCCLIQLHCTPFGQGYRGIGYFLDRELNIFPEAIQNQLRLCQRVYWNKFIGCVDEEYPWKEAVSRKMTRGAAGCLSSECFGKLSGSYMLVTSKHGKYAFSSQKLMTHWKNLHNVRGSSSTYTLSNHISLRSSRILETVPWHFIARLDMYIRVLFSLLDKTPPKKTKKSISSNKKRLNVYLGSVFDLFSKRIIFKCTSMF